MKILIKQRDFVISKAEMILNFIIDRGQEINKRQQTSHRLWAAFADYCSINEKKGIPFESVIKSLDIGWIKIRYQLQIRAKLCLEKFLVWCFTSRELIIFNPQKSCHRFQTSPAVNSRKRASHYFNLILMVRYFKAWLQLKKELKAC